MITINNVNIPINWDEVSYRKYIKVNKILESFATKVVDEAVTLRQNIFILSLMTDTPVNVFDDWNIKELTQAFKTLDFMVAAPDVTKGSYKWNIPDAKTITTDKWLAFDNLRSQLSKSDLPVENTTVDILSLLSGISPDEIWNLAAPEVLHGFFILRKRSTRSTISSLKSLYLKFLRKNWKEIPGALWLIIRILMQRIKIWLLQPFKKKQA